MRENINRHIYRFYINVFKMIYYEKYNMSSSVCKLRDAGVINNDGKISGFEGLTAQQATVVVRKILHIMRTTDIREYMVGRHISMQPGSKDKYINFPDDIVYIVLRNYMGATSPQAPP